MQSCRALAAGEQPLDRGGLLGVGIDPNPAHEVVQGRPDLHRLRGDVHLGQLLELVVHGGELLLDVVGGPVARDVEEGAAVGAAPSLFHLVEDGACHHVAGQQLRRPARLHVPAHPAVRLFLGIGRLRGEARGDVVEHEALALGVAKVASLTAHTLGDQCAAHRRRPDHARGVELGELDVHEFCASLVGHGRSVAGVLPGVGRDAPHLSATAGGQDHGLGLD